MRSTWSQYNASIPISSTARMWRTSCTSQANARTSKRWNSVTSPEVHSLWCRLIAEMPPGRGVHQMRAGSVAFRQQLAQEPQAARAQPQPRTGPPGAGERDDGRGGGPVLHVDRELEVGPQLGVELLQPRDSVPGEPLGQGAGDPD